MSRQIANRVLVGLILGPHLWAAEGEVCRDYQCELPVADPDKLAALLARRAAP